MSLSSGSIFREALHRVNSVSTRLPHLSRPQAQVRLALCSNGMVLTHTCGSTTIVVVLAHFLGQKEGALRWSRH